MNTTNPDQRFAWLGGLPAVVAAGIGLFAIGCSLAGPDSSKAQFAWVWGAAYLGLVTGLVTGATEKEGIGSQFLTFISGGILVPLFGGVVALMQFRQGTEEANTYVGEHLATKITKVIPPPEVEHLHPIWVLGAFFVLYGSGAIVGILLGLALRKGGMSIKLNR